MPTKKKRLVSLPEVVPVSKAAFPFLSLLFNCDQTVSFFVDMIGVLKKFLRKGKERFPDRL